MSWKDDYIAKYGQDAYDRKSLWNRNWSEANPELVKIRHQRRGRKGGEHYQKQLRYFHTGLQGKRNVVRGTHARRYREYKKIIAPDSQLHHQWRRESAGYDCVALVEKNQHMHGVIDVIRVLEGEVTLFTEKAIRER